MWPELYGPALILNDLQFDAGGGTDVFLTKYNPHGQLLWTRCGGGTGDDYANRLAVDCEGSCLVNGMFYGRANFGSLTLSNTLDPGSFDNYDFFVAKYDAAGNVAWARQTSQPRSASRSAVAMDAAGNCYLAAELEAGNVLYAKYAREGIPLWSRQVPQNLMLYHLRADAIGNCYISGSFQNTLTFDEMTLSTSGPPAPEVFLAKLDTSTAPPLSITPQADSVRLSWSVLATDFYLESSTNLSLDATWTTNADTPEVSDLSNVVVVPKSDGRRFYRLSRP